MDDRATGRARLLEAVLSISTDLDLPAMLDRIVRAAADLVDARYAALGVLDEARTRLTQFVTVGLTDEERRRIGRLPEGHGILGLLIADGEPIRLADLHEHPMSVGFPPGHPQMHSFLGVPIRIRDQVFGNLYLTDKTTGPVFTEEDEDLAVGLAAAAAVAIENARLHARLAELALADDRDRIARDLHDTVIQRLFAAGLSLQATPRLIGSDPDAAVVRIAAAVDELDLVIRHIRAAIFGLESGRLIGEGLRHRVVALCREASRGLGFEPRVTFDGAVDTIVPGDVEEEIGAVLREALSNVARHASARAVEVDVAATNGEVVVRVTDDGVGVLPRREDGSGNGMRNMATRATRLGGSWSIGPGPSDHGTVLTWRVPIDVTHR